MYREQKNGDMTKIKSNDVNFLGDEFLSIGGLKKGLELYKL